MSLLAEAVNTAEPWWIAAIVVPLALFSGWLVRWNLTKQDEREKVIAARESKREEREEKRAEHVEMQTKAMQECVVELRGLNQQQKLHAIALADVPARVAKILQEKNPT